VVADVLAGVEAGMVAAEIKEQIVAQLTVAGGSAPSCTVNVGAASALPHGGRSDAALMRSDVILIDGGVAWDGYRSDITRTYNFGQPQDALLRLMEIVLAAEAAAIAAVKPGAFAESIDAAARQVITEAGYGAEFTHRVGHGLGLEGKEPPYLAEGNRQALEPGMVITIEPGIYLPGEFGVRIEDDIVVTESGSALLSAPVESVEELIL
jgi:Xaa-Pro dipeptidase